MKEFKMNLSFICPDETLPHNSVQPIISEDIDSIEIKGNRLSNSLLCSRVEVKRIFEATS